MDTSTTASARVGTQLAPPSPEPRQYYRGDRLGKYTIRRVLARERHVYLGVDHRRRSAVLKVNPYPHRTSERLRKSRILENEYFLLQKLAGDDVVRAYYFDRVAGLVEEYLPLDHHAILRVERLGDGLDQRVAWYMHKVSRATARVHEKGYIHADLKPLNTRGILGPDGGLLVKLVDFSEARYASRQAPAERLQLGTQGYTPPFCEVERHGVLPPFDVYSLGKCMVSLAIQVRGREIAEVLGVVNQVTTQNIQSILASYDIARPFVLLARDCIDQPAKRPLAREVAERCGYLAVSK